jgi:hypothetical protein
VKIWAARALALLLMHGSLLPQHAAQKQTAVADQLGLTCAQILQMTSTEWIAHFNTAANQAKHASPGASDSARSTGEPSAETPDAQPTLRALTAYGKCYDARTDRLAASLAKTGKGPLLGARGDFRDFEAALNNFTAKAFSVAQPPSDAVKTAYAALYEKQLRYSFYQSYEHKPVKETVPSAKAASAAPADPVGPATNVQPPVTARITDPLSLAKNRFGELLEALPEDERHEIHLAFGEIFEKSSIGEQWKLEIYRYAIFVLESPKSTPFSPPPF